MKPLGVGSRARTYEDRAGDPLDGLVNLFDLGIVLSLAFLLAALSSLDLTEAITDEQRNAARRQSAARTSSAQRLVVTKPAEQVRPVALKPGERVVGQGEPVGTVYRLADGRTVIVERKGAPAATAP